LDEDAISSLAGRLGRFDREMDDKERKDIENVTNGKPLKQIINTLLDSIVPEMHIERAKEIFREDNPSAEQVKKAG